MHSHEEHKDRVEEKIRRTVNENSSQPVIFAGTGISKRYFSAPSWDELLKNMWSDCPETSNEYGYHRQNNTRQQMGEILSEKYAKHAWKNSLKYEPSHKENRDIYLKKKVSENLKSASPDNINEIDESFVYEEAKVDLMKREIKMLESIQPHAIITTNYDKLLEMIFNEKRDGEPTYEVIVGEEIVQNQYRSVGEILKIHGSVDKPGSLVLTESDYKNFNKNKRYLTSKMVTYLTEHPVLIVGYSVGDPNVRKILSWVKESQSPNNSIVNNIYFLKYERNIFNRDRFSSEKRIDLGQNGDITVNHIVAEEFDWVFELFAEGDGFEVDVRTLRKLMANTYEVIEKKTPEAKAVDVNKVEEVAEDPEELSTILGISSGGKDPTFQFNHNYRPQAMAEEIDLDNTTKLNNNIIKEIYEREGINITGFKNRYHIAIWGASSTPRAYSEAAKELFIKVRDGEDWELDIPEFRVPDNNGETKGIGKKWDIE
jgi:hypothetical protein